jgi:glycerophosphoryl diester phosphodiesterase
MMERASAHAAACGCKSVPALSPHDASVVDGSVPVAELQAAGIKVVPWTTNDPQTMRLLVRAEVDGLISDRPDLARTVADQVQFKKISVEGHRGARGLRPENTLPAFEAGLDCGVDVLETDTGVTADGVSLIWHDPFLHPHSFRRVDGAPPTLEDRVYIRDLTVAEAQAGFVGDGRPFSPQQRNELTLSPVAVAFAAAEGLVSPYVPTYVAQLFRFVSFYEEYYRSGPGWAHPEWAARAATAERVGFNIETKIVPSDEHTVGPQGFVDALCGAIAGAGMAARCDVQSFDFRTLVLVEEQFPEIATFYLTEEREGLWSDFVPLALRPDRV